MTSERRLAAILSADAAGFSRLMNEDESAAHRALKAERSIIDDAIRRNHGRIVGTAGDSVLAEFASVVDAVSAALEFQRALAASADSGQSLRFRVGINIGDVIVDGDQIYGDGVNVAARLQSLAAPGGIAISQAVHEQVKGKLGLEVRPRGSQKVKNIADPIVVYDVLLEAPGAAPRARRARRWPAAALAGIVLVAAAAVIALWHSGVFDGGARETASRTEAANGVSAKPILVVLPFVNQSANASDDYLSDGITDEIIIALGHVSSLAVIGRKSAFAYKGKAQPPQDIARALGARYLIEGTVSRAGDRVRVRAQLTDAMRGVLLWSNRYDREVRDVLAIQDEIARSIVGALAVKVTRLEQERAASKPPSDLAAYDYVLRGRSLLAAGTRSANLEAREMFAQAAKLDPRYARAYAGLGWARYLAITSGWEEFLDSALGEAEAQAHKALALDSDLAEAHTLLASLYLYRRDYDRALSEADRAIEINPSDAESLYTRGALLMWYGRWAEAVAVLETALRYDPTHERAAVNYGFALYLGRRYADAARVLQRTLTPGASRFTLVNGNAMLAAALAQQKRADEAARTADALRKLWPFFSAAAFAEQFKSGADRAHVLDGLTKAGLN